MQVVGAAIIDRGELLACRRMAPPHLAGRYEFPGGKVESGEEPRAALVREVREELGIEIACASEPLGAWPIDADVELLIYLAHLQGERPTVSSDHDDLVWLSRSQWRDGVPWVDIDRAALDLLEEHADRQQGGEGDQ